MKKIFISILILFGGYRLVQLYQWSETPKQPSNSNAGIKEIRLCKAHAVDAGEINQPITYTGHILKSPYKSYNQSDTIYLRASNRELVEIEVIGDSTATFESIDLSVGKDLQQEEIKPHINKRNDAYIVNENNLLFAFNPWVYTSDINNVVTVKIELYHDGTTIEKQIPIIVLSDKQYETYISSRLNYSERNKWIKLTKKYENRFVKSWKSDKYSKSILTSLSPDSFFSGLKYRNGKYTAEYFAYDGEYRVTLIASSPQKFFVEPKNVML